MIRINESRGKRFGRKAPHILLLGGALLVTSGVPIRSVENRLSVAGPPVLRAELPRDEPVIVLALAELPAPPAPVILAAAPLPVASDEPLVAPAALIAGSQPPLESWQAAPERANVPAPVFSWTAASVEDLRLATPEVRNVPSVPVPPVAKARAPAAANISAVLLGKWVPSREACVGADSSDYLPLQITASAATAGTGTCAFLSKRRVGATMHVIAECSDGNSTWTSNVTLAVTNRRLIWTSERGTATYERCEPVTAAATGNGAPKKERVAVHQRRAPKSAGVESSRKGVLRITSASNPTEVVAVLRR